MKKALFLISLCSLMLTSLRSQHADTWTTFNEEGDVTFSQETLKLLSDPAYRDTLYAMTNSLIRVPDMLHSQQYLLALYTLISHYTDESQRASTVARLLAQQGIGGQHYLHAFYTYIFADPDVYHISEAGPSYLKDPMLMETKLESCKTLIAYTEEYRRAMQPGQDKISSN